MALYRRFLLSTLVPLPLLAIAACVGGPDRGTTSSDGFGFGDDPSSDDPSSSSGDTSSGSSGTTTCTGGRNRCNGVCVTSSVQACGPSCAVCSGTANGTAVCLSNTCDVTCSVGYAKCATGCCLQKATAIASGSAHTCAITTTGAVKCWGYNVDGELGNNNRINQRSAVDVVGLTAGATSVSASGTTSCAVVSGATRCWGSNAFQQLPGVAQFSYSATPVDVSLGATSSFVVTGQTHSCAIVAGGGIKCWGDGGYGQLGNDASNDSPTPVDVNGHASGVAAAIAGYGHACLLTTGGGAKCWGKGDVGELGNSNSAHSDVPVDVTGLTSDVLAISGSYRFTCGLVMTGGVVKCWGENAGGLIWSGGASSNAAVTITGLPGAASAISAGESHVCAIVSGGLYCWGSNAQSQLGTGLASSATPTVVVGLGSGVASVSAGGDHTCALLTSGSVRCWGQNGVGQLGNNGSSPSGTPVAVAAFP